MRILLNNMEYVGEKTFGNRLIVSKSKIYVDDRIDNTAIFRMWLYFARLDSHVFIGLMHSIEWVAKRFSILESYNKMPIIIESIHRILLDVTARSSKSIATASIFFEKRFSDLH